MESTSRKIKWTLKNVTEDKLKQYDGKNRIKSPNFHICFDDHFYNWHLTTFVADEKFSFFVNFDRQYAKVLKITCKVRVSNVEKTFTVDSSKNLISGWGWSKLIAYKHLVNPAKNYIDENKNLVFNIEMSLEKSFLPQQADVPLAVGETNFAEFLNDDESSDASFTCSDGVKVQVHRIILMKKSAEFKKIFALMKQKRKRTHKLNNVDSVTMKEILKFAYTGSADLKDIQLVKKIYEAAITFDLSELQLQCIDSLSNQINTETVLDIFVMSEELKLTEVSEKCLTQIMKNFHQLRKIQKWKTMRSSMKEKILKAFAGNITDFELETTL